MWVKTGHTDSPMSEGIEALNEVLPFVNRATINVSHGKSWAIVVEDSDTRSASPYGLELRGYVRVHP